MATRGAFCDRKYQDLVPASWLEAKCRTRCTHRHDRALRQVRQFQLTVKLQWQRRALGATRSSMLVPCQCSSGIPVCVIRTPLGVS